MGLDFGKGNGTRCPPILVGGLMIMCLYLLCSWWSLSSQNSELLKQIDNLAEQLRVNGDELGKCSQQRNLLDEKLKDSQNRFVQQQIKIEQVKEAEDEVKENYEKAENELQESKKKSESAEKSLKMCQIEMESLKKLGESKDKASATLRSENESLKSDIEQKEKKIKELEEKLKGINKTGDLLSKNKFMQSLVKNYDNSVKKNQQKTVNKSKTEQEVNGLQYGDQQQEEKYAEAKNYGDSGLLSVDNDPREEEMRAS